MLAWVAQPAPVPPALLATGFPWVVTALGAAMGFLVRERRRRLLDLMRGLAPGPGRDSRSWWRRASVWGKLA